MDRSVQSEGFTRWIPTLANVLWLILGVTFIASGILKGIAMKGFAITVKEFLDLLGLETLQTLSFPIAIAICVFETAIGALAFIRSMRPLLSLVYPAIMAFFTLITYVNLTDMYGGIESCGCFGEVIHLGPSETFVKNLILLTLSVIAAYLTHIDPQSK
ncbi:MAG: hypothetical protein HDS37_02155 [Bacteroides sp.]|nr:hypothetical protein [Bacteroides sp.]